MTDRRTIDAAVKPKLLPWLSRTLQAVEVEMEDYFAESPYAVKITNGLDGEDHSETIIARCETELDAELVAAAMWALVI